MLVPDALSRAFDDRAAAYGVWDELEHTYASKLTPEVDQLNAKTPMDINVHYIQPDNVTAEKTKLGGVCVVKDINVELNKVSPWEGLQPKVRKQSGMRPKAKHKNDVGVFTFATKVFGDVGTIIKSSYSQDNDFKEIYELCKQPIEALSKVQR